MTDTAVMRDDSLASEAAAPVRPKRKYLEHIHKFRGVAIIFIVATHSLPSLDWSANRTMFEVLESIIYQASIWFVFMAGFLFQYLSTNFDTLSYWKQKLKVVILPYILLSIPAIFASVTFIEQQGMPPGFYDQPLAVQVFEFLITGNQLAPFWFIPMIVLIYLAAPILIKWDRAVWPYWFIIPLFVLSLVMGRTGIQMITGMGFLGMPVGTAVYFLSVYMFGMFCSQFHDPLMVAMRRLWLPCLVIAAGAVILNIIFYDKTGFGFYGAPIVFLFIAKFVSSPLITYALYKRPSFGGKWMNHVGHVSFGIYFVHGYVFAGFQLLWRMLVAPTLPAGGLGSFILLTIAGLALSCALIWAAQKMLGKRSRYVIGV